MRDIKTLLRAGTSADKVADYRWRSAEEIIFYVQSLTGGPEVASHSRLERAALTKTYSDLVEIQNRLDSLVGLEVCAAYEFKKHQLRLKSCIATARKDLESRRNRALSKIQRAAQKHEPVELAHLTKAVQQAVTAKFLGKHTQVKDYVYASAFGSAGFEFNHYIQYNSLYNKEVGFLYPEYYLVLTARVADSKTTLHVNVLHEFRAPGNFNVGESTTASKLPAAVTSLLRADEFA
jgi:hypothetical protein